MSMSIQARRTAAEQRKAEAFNARHHIGTPVYYRTDQNGIVETRTRTNASVLSGHTAVVWLDDITGCVSLERVTPRAEQSGA
jgi:hypothetical protein